MSTNAGFGGHGLADEIGGRDLANDIGSLFEGDTQGQRAQRVHEGLTTAWGMPEVVVNRNGMTGVPISALKQRYFNDPEELEETFGTRHPFVLAAMTGTGYEPDTLEGNSRTTRAIKTMSTEAEQGRALVDEGIIGAAAPVEVDPVITDVQRRAAPELDVIQSISQAGFSFQYNVIDQREDPSYLSEADAAGDLESNITPQSFTLSDDTLDMKRLVGLVKVSDFSQRAMETLEYMDPRETSLGQATIAHSLKKAKTLFYGDPSVGASDGSIEDTTAITGIAKKADDAGNSIDKSTVSSGILEDLLDELTTKIQNTGLTYDRARYMVSPFMYNAIYDESTPVVRLDGYDADVEYGPQGIAISTEQGSVPITMAPNIRAYGGLSGVGSNASTGDVFLVDELALQFRQLAPMSTVPLGRTGLADRVALFEYFQIVDKSQGEHLLWLQDYDI